MQLRQNTRNPLLLEDELGNPIFLFLGTHAGDIERYLWSINNHKKETVESLESQIEDLETQLERISEVLTDGRLSENQMIDEISNLV
jgi:hypothetical protein